MHFDWWTVAFQTVNFAVLVWLLHRLLYRPVLRLIDARRGEIDRLYADAATAGDAARAEREKLRAERAGVAAEKERLLREAGAQAEAAAKDRRSAADAEAAALIAAAHQAIDDERAKALAEAHQAAFDLGADIARRLFAELPPALRAEGWLPRVERHVAALSASQRAELLRGAGDTAAVTAVTATPLPADAADAWRRRLADVLGRPLSMDFQVDADLVAGVELLFPNAILRFSWQSALEDLRRAASWHADAG